MAIEFGQVTSRYPELLVPASAGNLHRKATDARANVVVRLLDAQVKSVLADDPKALAGWKSAKRIGRGRTTPTEAAAA